MRRTFLLAAMAALNTGVAQAATLEEKVDILTQEVEELKAGKAGAPQAAEEGATYTGLEHGAPSHVRLTHERAAGKTSVGSYGELHFNNLENQQTGAGSDVIDLHRFILFVGHNFNDRIRFFSEIEIEHAVTAGGSECELEVPAGGLLPGDVAPVSCEAEDPGEVEMEQAFLEFDLGTRAIAQAGLFVLPIGIINETHEPPTFYGVERNPIERNIIPTTWWEGGGQMIFRLPAGLSANVAYSSGLGVGSDFSIRNGRGQVAEALANDPAYTARLKWTGVPGIEVAGSFQYQKDIGQGQVAGLEDATLAEAHVAMNKGMFGLRALYAVWNLNGTAPKAVGADEQFGYYVEPSLRFGPVGVFARYNVWDTRAGDSIGSERTQTDLGVSYWPHEYVVIKADIQKQDNDNAVTNNEIDGFNLGVGYMF